MAPRRAASRRHFVAAGRGRNHRSPDRESKEAPGQAIGEYLPPPQKHWDTGGSELLAAMEALMPLVASPGADKVRRIVDLLG